MLKKLFYILLGIAVGVMLFFTFYSYSWLQSIGSPEVAAENFNFYANLAWSFLWVSFVVLVVVANGILWKYGRSWTLWGAFVYFAIFIVLQTFWLAPTLLSFLKTSNLTESTYTFTPVIGAMTIVVLSIATFFDQFIVMRLREKVVGDDSDVAEEVELDEETIE